MVAVARKGCEDLESQDGRERPAEVMQKLHEQNIGRKRSDEARQRMSESHIRAAAT